jgi:hypothetical protein
MDGVLRTCIEQIRRKYAAQCPVDNAVLQIEVRSHDGHEHGALLLAYVDGAAEEDSRAPARSAPGRQPADSARPPAAADGVGAGPISHQFSTSQNLSRKLDPPQNAVTLTCTHHNPPAASRVLPPIHETTRGASV